MEAIKIEILLCLSLADGYKTSFKVGFFQPFSRTRSQVTRMFSLLDKSLSDGTETDAAAAFLGSPGRGVAGPTCRSQTHDFSLQSAALQVMKDSQRVCLRVWSQSCRATAVQKCIFSGNTFGIRNTEKSKFQYGSEAA